MVICFDDTENIIHVKEDVILYATKDVDESAIILFKENMKYLQLKTV